MKKRLYEYIVTFTSKKVKPVIVHAPSITAAKKLVAKKLEGVQSVKAKQYGNR